MLQTNTLFNFPFSLQVAKTVTIVILDMNDNSPTFENAPMNNVSIALSEVSTMHIAIYKQLN